MTDSPITDSPTNQCYPLATAHIKSPSFDKMWYSLEVMGHHDVTVAVSSSYIWIYLIFIGIYYLQSPHNGLSEIRNNYAIYPLYKLLMNL